MARYRGPLNRIARRFGINIFGRTRNPLAHKPNPPGMHGAKRKKKSDFGLQLDEKQKLKASYGMMPEGRLVSYYQEASRLHGNTPERFLQLLECRLDTLVFRMKLASTMFAAQQLVAHGHVLVNGQKVDRRSFQVRPGMTISLKEKSRKMKAVHEAKESGMRAVPDYMQLVDDGFAAQLTAKPSMDQISLPIEGLNIPMICDFLAHSH